MKRRRRASHLGLDLLCGITAAELHNSIDLLCGTAGAYLHNSVDLLCGTTDAELHNSPVNLLCGTTDAELNNPIWCMPVFLASRRCKSCSFFDWIFSRLQHPWSWLRSLLIPLRFWELNLVKIFFRCLCLFCQRFTVIAFTFHFWKVSTQFGQ